MRKSVAQSRITIDSESDDSDSVSSSDHDVSDYSPTEDDICTHGVDHADYLDTVNNCSPRRSSRLNTKPSSTSTYALKSSSLNKNDVSESKSEYFHSILSADTQSDDSGSQSNLLFRKTSATTKSDLPSKKSAEFPSINCSFDAKSIFSSSVSATPEMQRSCPTFEHILYCAYRHSVINSEQQPEPFSSSLLEQLNWHKEYVQIACAMTPDAFCCKFDRNSQPFF